MSNFKFDDVVKIIGKNAKGKIAFIGKTHFSDGIWFGVILDEPKGRNNGTVDGITYFRCPRNHGVFVRDCQMEKEILENSIAPKRVRDKMQRKNTYPNYLRSGSKLKSKTNLTISRNGDNIWNNKLKQAKNVIAEKHHNDIIAEKEEALLKMKTQAEELKMKQKDIEELLQDTLKKYTQAIEENKNLRDELTKAKKQIITLKSSRKPTNSGQSDDKKAELLKFSNIKSNCSPENVCALKANAMRSEKYQKFSEKQLDSDTLKTMSSLNRLAELEEQNKIMIQGLMELRDFLKTNCEVPFLKCLEATNDRSKCQSALNARKITRTVRASNRLSPKIPMRMEHLRPMSSLQEFQKMLSEMTTFSKILKERGKRELNTPESISNTEYGNNNFSPKEYPWKSSNTYKISQQYLYPKSSNVYTADSSEFTKFSKESETTHKQSISNNGDIQICQVDAEQIKRCLNNMSPEANQEPQVHCVNDKSSLKTADCSKEMKQLKYSLESTVENTVQSSTSSLRQDVLMEARSLSNLFMAKSNSMPELSLLKSDDVFLSSIRPLENGDMIISNDTNPKKKMF